MPYLFLFDIDHTLLTESKIHRMAFHTSMKEIYGKEVSIDDIPHAGMTDQQIIIGVLKKHGIEESVIHSNIELCKKRMCVLFKEHITPETITRMPGVLDLLKEVQDRGHKTALVTGNLECIARKKIEVSGLSQYFPVGGFGSDSMERKENIKSAILRSEQFYGELFNNNVVLIGDTIRDIHAGREAHVRTIGVSTGYVPYDELKKSGAHLVIQSLLEKDKIFSLIGE